MLTVWLALETKNTWSGLGKDHGFYILYLCISGLSLEAYNSTIFNSAH